MDATGPWTHWFLHVLVLGCCRFSHVQDFAGCALCAVGAANRLVGNACVEVTPKNVACNQDRHAKVPKFVQVAPAPTWLSFLVLQALPSGLHNDKSAQESSAGILLGSQKLQAPSCM
eukprot:scaffold30916_cov18-Tisochrysis_lutea.AAC.1